MAWYVRTNVKLAVKRGNDIIFNGDASLFKLTTDAANMILPGINDLDYTASSVYYNNGPGGRDFTFYAQEVASMTPLFTDAGILALNLTVNEELTIYNPNLGPRNALLIRAVSNNTNYPLRIEMGAIINGTKRYSSTYRYLGSDGRDRGLFTIGVVADPDNYNALFFNLYGYDYSPGGSSTKSVSMTWWKHAGYPSPTLSELKVLDWYVVATEWVPPAPPSTDEPYGDDTYSESSGGEGDHDDTSDTISEDAIPIASATRSGMCTAWVPNWGEIQDVADALLDPNIFQILGSNVVKFSDVIIGLSIFPCAIPATDVDTVKANVLGIEIGTGVQAHIANNQFVSIDCGTLDVKEYWGNCLDYNPYTRISIFLPFCGTYELDVDEVMGKTINVSYRIDIMSGACLATIKIDGSVFYQYSGQCSAQVPLSSVSFDQFLSSMINLGVATATGVGAIGAAGAGVKEAETAFHAAGSYGSGGSALMEAREHLSAVKTQSANSIADATVGAVMGSKGFYQHAGAMSGSPGFLGVKTPYLIIKRPEQLIPGMYGKFHGFPSNTTAVLGDLVGYTEVGDIRLNIPDATVEEIIECEQLLKGGVVI